MKIKSLLVGMLACTALVGCSNEDEVLNGEQGVESRGEKGYMAVNLVNPEMGSRAYQDGEGNEVKVGKIRFYFFGDNGTAYKVTDALNVNGANYVEVTPEVGDVSDSDPANDNVNKITSAHIVINKSKVAPPKSVVAILNADNLKDDKGVSLLGDVGMSLSALTAIVGQAGFGIDGTGENEFVMTNSVYKHAVTGETMVATPISVNDIYTNVSDAEDHPVNIYVERVLAKVSTSLEKGDLFDTDAKFGDKKVFAKINGWAVTNYNDRSNLFKSLSWTTDPSFTWNAAGDFRSFWAATAAPSTGAKKYSESYKNESTHTSLTSDAEKYCLENTDQAAGKQTQLLVGATLVDEQGTPLTIARWMGVDYTVEDLKTQLAGALAYDYYYKVSETKYASITDEYIDFTNPDNTWAADEKRYEVKATLASGKTVYKKNGVDAQGNPVMKPANDEANAVLAKYPVWIWTSGATYYYVAIKHIGTENAIVRNHLYDINVTGVSGFGTPVYNPDEIILPQTPVGEDTYIAASVNILSWKVVENDGVVLGQ